MADLRMPEINCLHVAGRIASEIMSRTFDATGNTLCEFSMAVSRHVGTGDRRKEETAWLRVKAWGRMADYVVGHMRKGDAVYVEARVATEEWEKDGKRQQKTLFVASRVLPLSWRDKGDQEPKQQPQRQASQATQPVDEDEIPF